jgi:hypothetical protein
MAYGCLILGKSWHPNGKWLLNPGYDSDDSETKAPEIPKWRMGA